MQEAHEKGAQFEGFTIPHGEKFLNEEKIPNEVQTGNLGVKIVFRTKQFSGTTPTTVTEPVEMNASGSWALTAN